MNVLSLFDGISCGRIALERAGIHVDNYLSSEIEPNAIKIARKNYPGNWILGDVTKWREWDIDWKLIDLLIGGSPCQGFSFAGKQLAFDDPRSALFFVYVDILNHIRSVNPDVKFLLENVKMKKEHLAVITEMLGVEPVFINSNLVSAQNRQRYYWCNWKVTQPEDKGIELYQILESNPENVTEMPETFIKRQAGRKCLRTDFTGKASSLSAMEYVKNGKQGDYVVIVQFPRGKNKGGIMAKDGKTPTMTSFYWEHNNHLQINDRFRKLTPIECERLQTLLQYIKPVEIFLCLEQAKSFVHAVEKNPKLLKLVLSAESKELKEYAKLAGQNMNASKAPINSTAPQVADTQIQMQTKRCTKCNQEDLNSIAGSAENITAYQQAESVDSSAILSAFIDITEGKITRYGREESRQIEQSYTQRQNGKIVLKLFGCETMQNAKDASSVLEMMQINRHSTSITSFRLSTKNLEQILSISYWFAKNATDGFTQGTTQRGALYLNLIDGYTAGVSNTQRYKAIGNGWTVDVIAHIFSALI
jgi:site-specific DNA-cytosine methylase